MSKTILLVSVSSALGGFAAFSDAALTFQSQTRFTEVYTVPNYGLSPLRLTATSLDGYTIHGRRRTPEAFGEVHQDSTVSDRPTVVGDATATAQGIGLGHAQSFYSMTFAPDADSDFFFNFNAAALSTSVVTHFHMHLSGEGVDFRTDPARAALSMGEGYDLSGSGTFLAGRSYTIEIDFMVEASAGSAPGGGTFAFALVPSPGTAMTMGLLLLPATRRRR